MSLGAVVISLAGSSAMVPLATEAAGRYMRAHPEVTVQIAGGGSRQGLAQVASGVLSIGDSDVFAPRELAGQLTDHRVAVVGVAPQGPRGGGV